MADATSPCQPLVSCDGLDGHVSVRRTIYGPVLLRQLQSVSFGEFSVAGGAIRPYIELIFETTWVPKGLCRGPVASVMSLAPTESITAGVRVERRRSFTDLMTDAFESSFGSTLTIHNLGESTAQTQSGGGGGGGGGSIVNTIFDLLPLAILAFGSIIDDVWDFAGDAVDAVGDVAGGVVDFVGGAVGNMFSSGGGGPILTDTQRQLNEVTNTIEYRESQSHVHQVVVSDSVTREEFVRRTFFNPYRDRSLQLRFMPIFRQFEVVTRLRVATPGLALLVGNIDPRLQQTVSGPVIPAQPADSKLNPAAATRAAITSLQVKGDYVALQRPMAELLGGNRRTVEKNRVRIERGLQWRATEVRGNAVHVPLADSQTLIKAWNLDKATASNLAKNVSRLEPTKLEKIFTHMRVINLFAGTHVEAVPGECTLPDIITDAVSVKEKDGD